MTYGLDIAERRPLQASYIVRILGGATPADLPIVFPPALLTINLKTARKQGIEFSPSILAHADVGIE